jgi:hypothetical protein
MIKSNRAWRRIQGKPCSAFCSHLASPPTPSRVRMQNRAFSLAYMETWKAIPGYEGLYEVSDQGRVRNAKKHVLAPNQMVNGYLCVHLYANGKHTRSPKTIHRLVAKVFLPNGKDDQEVNHKNFNRHDNRAENLEWVTSRENVWHSIAAGRYSRPARQIVGVHVDNKSRVVFDSQIAAERALRGKQTGNLSGAMKRGRPAYGYVWSYA